MNLPNRFGFYRLGQQIGFGTLVCLSLMVTGCNSGSTSDADTDTADSPATADTPIAAISDAAVTSAIASMGALVRGQEAALLINGAFADSIEGVDVGIPAENEDYSFAVTSTDGATVVMTATSKTGDLPSVVGAVQKINETETTRIVCVSEAASAEAPSAPTLEGTALACPAGSKSAE